MIEFLEKIDRELFMAINGLHNPYLDDLMWIVSGKLEWIPLYLIFLYLIIKNFRKKTGIILLALALLVTLSDQLSVHLFKDVFERYRPCHNLEIQDLVHRVNNKCGGKFGFISSHASNTFAVATFLVFIFWKRYQYWVSLFLFWAVLVSYSRIYLGVHYPSDVFGGALFGSLLAIIVFKTISPFLNKSMNS